MEDNTFTPNEPANPKTGSVTLTYGVLLAVALIIFSLLMFVLVEDKMSKLNYLSNLILLGGIIWAQINFRDKQMSGFISYGKSFTVGFLTALFAGLILAIYTYIFYKYISPGTIDEIMQVSEQKMMEQGLDDQELDMALSMARKFNNPVVYSIFAILGNAFIGLVISLLSSIFIKRENPEEFTV
jgi:hypothetical protein